MQLAEFLCWLGVIFSIASGIVLIVLGVTFQNSSSFILYGILSILFGPLLSWVNSFVLYGFGRLVENSDIIANRK